MADTNTATQAEVERLLEDLPPLPRIAERVDAISALLLGAPYLVGPLVGGPHEPEVMVTRLDGFDCVTYVEAVLALARSESPEGYLRELRRIRYTRSQVLWWARNHHTSTWFFENTRVGVLAPVTTGREVQGDDWRRLSTLDGYPPLPWLPRYLPAGTIADNPLSTGDVLGFVSRRSDLDTFHVGLAAPGLQLRHASRSRREVVEEDLSGFCHRNDCHGLLLARPLPPLAENRP